MNTLSASRERGDYGRPTRNDPEFKRAELVRAWTDHPKTDWLIFQAESALESDRLEASKKALESLGELATRHDHQIAVAKPLVAKLTEKSPDPEAFATLWHHYVQAYRLHRAPDFAPRIEALQDTIRRAVASDAASGSADFPAASAAYEDAILAVGDNFDPMLDPHTLAAGLNAALDGVPWKDDVEAEDEAGSTISGMFLGRRIKLEEQFEASFPYLVPRRFYGVTPPAPEASERFEITLFGEIEENPVKEWLVDGVLGDGEFSCFWGMPGCGKSVAVGDAAFHVAAGLPWFDRPVRKGLVVYIAAERAELTKRRFAALRKEHGHPDAPLAVIKGRLDFTSGLEDANAIVEAVRLIERRTGQRCVWLIIDTVARTFGAGDENAAKDMGAYVQACDSIREGVAAHVSLIHHCARNGEKPRGSIALDGAVDATFKVAKNGGIHSVVLDKENDSPDAGAIRFTMKSIELGRDRNDRPTTAPVVVPDTSTVASFETADGVRIALSRNKPRKAAVVLAQALGEIGQLHPNGRRAVAESELRTRLREVFGSGNAKESSLDAIVRRELKGLIDRGDAEKLGEWFLAKQTDSVPEQED